jgi:predicted cupin superfamily sugar epimerase
MSTKEYFISNLNLEKHPEGGFFRFIHANPVSTDVPGRNGSRYLSTSIYYLLGHEDRSHFHRLECEETWCVHNVTQGHHFLVHMLAQENPNTNDGKYAYSTQKLGYELHSGEQLQVVVPAGTIFGVELVKSAEASATDIDASNVFGTVSCICAPGFDYRDFHVYTKADMRAVFDRTIGDVAHLSYMALDSKPDHKADGQ